MLQQNMMPASATLGLGLQRQSGGVSQYYMQKHLVFIARIVCLGRSVHPIRLEKFPSEQNFTQSFFLGGMFGYSEMGDGDRGRAEEALL